MFMDNLRQLMAAYFHEDWSDEYDGAWESAVDDFARREPDRITGVVQEIAALLTGTGSDVAVGKALDALGNFREPGDAQDANRTWLVQIQARLTSSADLAQQRG
jgi:hypothetical protein